ncbi:hypothetical protein H5V45_13625 [Nocardioides sp. KIGAM211]|uniref:WXG100 family type VII secretion target n=1 Tax=Nocardioides luti TaxID=2761101 RepID=A0A7X0VB77_9ACTN|nr:hypothetical protein [Nocardioides luti]MBB6628361.1 hypothetical protein [Nocardioides luti]
MTEIAIDYKTLSLSQQVLERQQGHAQKIATYLPANADIGDSTGVLLSMFDPLSRVAVDLGSQAATALAGIETATAASVGDTAVDLADSDGKVGDAFSKLIARLGGPGGTASSPYPDLGGPTLGAASGGAEDGYGGVEGNLITKAYATGENLGNSINDAQSLIDSLGQWGSGGTVTEVSDASSYLVPGQSPENFVQDLRWSAGALLGSIDWVAEKFIGFSILDRCVFHPLAGDWEGIYRCSEAWSHAGDAANAIAHNHAGLVAQTPDTWKGLSGNSFRVAMTTMTEACIGLSTVYGTASGYVKTISTACKLACAGIGAGLQFIANKLIKLAAEAATPVIGWAIGAATAYGDIQDVINKVRLIYTIIETIASAIQDFAEAKTGIMDKLAILEDLLQGATSSAANA